MQEAAQAALQDISDERLENAVAAGLAEARQKQKQISRPEAGEHSSQQDGSKALPAPDSLEASETSAIEETYASTHQ